MRMVKSSLRADIGHVLVTQLDRPHLVRLVVFEVADVVFELAPDRGAVVEQRRGVVAGQARALGQRLAAQPLEVPPLDEKDVVHQPADRFGSRGLHRGARALPDVR